MKQHNINAEKVELLAPAGSWEALVAAVQNGADAVYLGGKNFSARQNAANFDKDTLKKAIDYAHLRNVKVYLTMNTLVTDDEMIEAINTAEDAYLSGIDAIIVQDLGFAGKLKQLFPGIEMHASTQMTVYDAYGVKALQKMGFKRIVLARELSLTEIARIYDETKADLEIFIHGALCVSYSGQCLLSSMIGGRSGNRGKCAQPCRLPYSLTERDETGKLVPLAVDRNSRYLMSPKDLASLEFLPEIMGSGVKSLKIEGRMKTPEYVGLVTGIYRKYIDQLNAKLSQTTDDSKKVNRPDIKVDKADLDMLLQMFNRGGFTKGYLKNQRGRELMAYDKPKNWGVYLGEVVSFNPQSNLIQASLKETLYQGDGVEVWNGEEKSPGNVVTEILYQNRHVKEVHSGQIAEIGRFSGKIQKGDKLYKTTSKLLNEAVRKTYENQIENKRRPIEGEIRILDGSVCSLNIKDLILDISIEAIGEKLPEKAINKPLSRERIDEQIRKTGGTPFDFQKLNIQISPDMTLPVSELNLVRRKAFDLLMQRILHKANYPERVHSGKAHVKEIYQQNNVIAQMNRQHPALSIHLNLGCLRLNSMDWNALNAARIILPLSDFFDDRVIPIVSAIRNSKKEVLIKLPSIMKKGYHKQLKEHIDRILSLSDGIMIGNINGLEIIKTYGLQGKKLSGEYTLNLFNSDSLQYLGRLGILPLTLSPELSIAQIKNMVPGTQKECIVYGRIPVMTSEYCPMGSVKGLCGNKKAGSCSNTMHYLVDRLGMEFPIYTDPIECRSILFNSKYLFMDNKLKDLLETDVHWFRLNITDESPEEICDISRLYNTLIYADRGQSGLTDHVNQTALTALPYQTEYMEYSERLDLLNDNALEKISGAIRNKGVTHGHYYRGV